MATKEFTIKECTSEECCKDCKDKTARCFQLCERYIPDNNLATMKIKEYSVPDCYDLQCEARKPKLNKELEEEKCQ